MPVNASRIDTEIIIVGTGFSGLGMAIALQKARMSSFLLLERDQDLGGTWRDNHYPGAACDIASHLYSFSFFLNPAWTRIYANQAEILSYLHKTSQHHQLHPHIRFNTSMLGAKYEDTSKTWHVTTSSGLLKCRCLVLATGALSEPSVPEIPGLNQFKGRFFHSARWDHTQSLAGQRVAVIGTGASAIQFVPEIVNPAARVQIFQRTPPWVVPRQDQAISSTQQSVFQRFPSLMRLSRWHIHWSNELRAFGTVLNPKLMRFAQSIALKHLAQQVCDPILRQKLTPDYTIGCKRILISDTWYPALCKDHVDVITDSIAHIEPHGVMTVNNAYYAADTLIFGTGFKATSFLSSLHIQGLGGRTLNQAWQDSPQAYLGAVVSGFPNMFMINGPNTGLGHNSMIFIIEANIHHILQGLQCVYQRHQASIEVKLAVQRHFNEWLRARLRRSVWLTGCKSWYRDGRTGEVTTLWPGFSTHYWLRSRFLKHKDYLIT